MTNHVRLLYLSSAFSAGIIILGLMTTANAALIGRLPLGGGGAFQAVYDNDLNITWLADANLATSNTFGLSSITMFAPLGSAGVRPDGSMIFASAINWIAGMNAANYLGFNDWRLPTTLQPDATCSVEGGTLASRGYNCTGSEMGHLFYPELSGTAGNTIALSSDADLSLFNGTIANTPFGYFSSTPDATGITGNRSWAFNFAGGDQFSALNDVHHFAWAVRDGDSFVPIPATAWLFISGLIGLIGISRKRKHA